MAVDDTALPHPETSDKYGDWRASFSGSSTTGLVCRMCHALVAHTGSHPQQHLAWHERLEARPEEASR
ncbi:hypothetical protein C7S10_06995 [Nocardioides currus]|uniref:Uncharacterized protein n=1 Tax=Nocardioides currus TaxID=2133958 RepID=A0A2R7YZR0_9ACTN|nr:hypothetical protein C7S10_06995 [Nocardioides currus]